MFADSQHPRMWHALMCVALLSSAGCLNPGMYYGYPQSYPYPGYAPPQSINPAAPGNLVIPESSGPAYNPGGAIDDFGSTYEDDPDDDFQRSDDGRFFQPDPDDDLVPRPRNRGEDLGDGVMMQPATGGIRQVSAVSDPIEFGFDTREYRWLRGTVQFNSRARGWEVMYSAGRGDRYRGTLSLSASREQTRSLRNGDWVDVHGQVLESSRDPLGRPMYKVESIVRLTP